MTRRLPAAHEVVEKALSHSDSDACIVIVEEATEVEARFANNTTTTNGSRRERRVVVASIRARSGSMAVGVASSSGDPEVDELVRASEADAEGAPVADDAAPLVGPGPAEGRSFTEAPRVTDLTALGGVVSDLGSAFATARGKGHVLAGFATHRLETVYLGTSTGVRRRHEQPTGSLELVARSADGGASAWTSAAAPSFEDVDLGAMHRTLEQRLSWAARRVELPAGRYETILPADATADLMIPLLQALSGRDAEDGQNAFAAPGGGTRVGERIAGLPFTLRSDPAEPGLECIPFLVAGASGTDVSVFDNGVPLERTSWVEQGVLQRLRYHRAGAGRSGRPPAAPIDNLVLEVPGATARLDDMVAATGRGLLLTCLWYIREVDPVTLLLTGLTRDGVYLVEGGEVVGAVNNFRFNESPVDLLSRVVEASRTERALSRESGEWLNRTAMPALRVADFNMSTVSAAM